MRQLPEILHALIYSLIFVLNSANFHLGTTNVPRSSILRALERPL